MLRGVPSVVAEPAHPAQARNSAAGSLPDSFDLLADSAAVVCHTVPVANTQSHPVLRKEWRQG